MRPLAPVLSSASQRTAQAQDDPSPLTPLRSAFVDYRRPRRIHYVVPDPAVSSRLPSLPTRERAYDKLHTRAHLPIG